MIALTFSVSSSAETVATVSTSGNILTVTEVGLGVTTITVTANDSSGGSVTDEFILTIEALVSGIEDEILSQIKVYPNPTSDYLKIDLSETKGWFLQIFEPSGRIIEDIHELKQFNTIDISRWKGGLYYFRLFNGTQFTTTKVLIGG